jgi:hypothetical protein
MSIQLLRHLKNAQNKFLPASRVADPDLHGPNPDLGVEIALYFTTNIQYLKFLKKASFGIHQKQN